MQKVWKYLCIAGMVGAVGYLLHVVIGGALWPGYNHLMQPISDLTGSGAHDLAIENTILLFYGPPCIVFGFAAMMYLRGFAPRITQTGMLLYFLMQLVSIMYNFFPQDVPGITTFPGTMHLVITFAIIPLTILAPILLGIGIRKVEGFRGFGKYSIISGIILFIAGGTTAMFFANGLPYFGLVERINIGTLQLWTFITAYKFVTIDTSALPKWNGDAKKG